jgi:pimeloyl-ACP methyl ester carboxylesterase
MVGVAPIDAAPVGPGVAQLLNIARKDKQQAAIFIEIDPRGQKFRNLTRTVKDRANVTELFRLSPELLHCNIVEPLETFCGVLLMRLSQSTIWATAAASLVGAAIYNEAQRRAAERKTPPIGSFLEVDGVRLHYWKQGGGRPLVLLHGNGATIQDLQLSGLIDAAAQRYQIIAFDRPGFGYSERPRSRLWCPTAQAQLIRRAIRALGIERPIVWGHSWGSQVALAMALDHPEDVAALVLVSGYYFPTARADVALFSPPAIPVAGDVLRHTLSPVAARAMAPAVFKTLFSPQEVPEVMTRWPIGLASRPSQLRAAAADTAFMVPAAAELSKRYGELALPLVIVAGDGDKIADFRSQSAALHKAVAGSELIILEGVGHMAHYADPARLVAAIDRAAQQVQDEADPAPSGEDLIQPFPSRSL